MKKLIKLWLLLLLFTGFAHGQSINSGEYFFDTDPGAGNGIPLSGIISGDSINYTTSVSISSLSYGFHQLCVRTKNANGNWGLPLNNWFYIYSPAEISIPNQPAINSAEYFIDVDPGVGNGTPLTGIVSGDSINYTGNISIAGKSVGFHQFCVRTKNANGIWSLPHNSWFTVFDTTSANNSQIIQPQITAAEYFIDIDPGVGNGSPLTGMVAGDSINYTGNISIAGKSVGFHQFCIRTKNANGIWSLPHNSWFTIFDTSSSNASQVNQPQIVAAEYFFDTDPGVGNGISIAGIIAGDSIEFTKSASIATLSVGFHRLYTRIKNANGIWSLQDEELFYIYSTTSPTLPPASAQLKKVEYFFDNTDPGVGLGTQINASLVGDSISIIDSVNITALPAGVHRITFRSMDISGKWGFSETQEFTVLPCTLPIPNFTFSDVCIGDTVQLINTSTNLNSPVYAWDIENNGSIDYTNSGNVSHLFPTAGTFQIKLKITNQNLCSDSIVKTVNVHALPNAITSATGNTTFCLGLSVVLAGNTGTLFNYQWQKDSVNIVGAANLFYTATSQGNYRFILTDGYGCKNFSNNLMVTVNPVPLVNITPSTSTVFCQGDSLFFTANNDINYNYQWKLNGVNIANSDTSGLWVKQAGLLSVQITNTFGCSANSSNSAVTMNYPPFASIFALGSTTFCDGDSVGLGTTSGAGFVYQWFKNSTPVTSTNQAVYYPKESGNFSSKVTNIDGCSSVSNPISILVNPLPIANFATQNQICQTDTATINFTGTSYGNALFNWNFGGGTILSGIGQGPYKVKFSSGGNKIIQLQLIENSCSSNSKKDSVFVNAFSVNLSSISNPVICNGDSMILFVNSSISFLYQWYRNGTIIPNANQSSFTATLAGDYTVFVQDTSGGCSAWSNILSLTVNSRNFNLAFSASPTTMTAPPFNVLFTNSTPNYTNYFFEWSFNDGSTSTFFNPQHNYPYNGVYTVRLTAENQTTGCRDTLIKNNYISCSGGQNNPCVITASISSNGPSLICSGDSTKLEANLGAGLSYQWTHNNVVIANANQAVFYAKAAGSYRVIVSDAFCSVVSTPFILSHYPAIQPIIISQGSITPCTNDSMKLLLLNNYVSYKWSTMDTNSEIWVNQTAYYTVTVTNNYGCHLVSNPYSVNTSFLMPPTICVVGVDSANHNRIIWEKPNTQLIDSFFIYREGFIAGDYEKIGSLPYSASGIFSDTNSNPQVRAYRYKLAALDTCGQMTLLSDFHKSIHLTINAGINGTWNLMWDGYTGFQFGSYRIYRGTNANNLSLLTQIQSSLNSYSDINPPIGNVVYQIEVIKPIGCYPDSIYSKSNTNYNSSRSNTANNTMAQPPLMQADFIADKSWGFLPTIIKFTDESIGYPTGWLWDFGDGQSSTQQNPSHTYNSEGIYNVSLTITNVFGNASITKSAFIYIITNGLDEHNANLKCVIYPNPTDGNFTLWLDAKVKQDISLEIINSLGQMVYQEEIQIQSGEFKKEIQLNNLNKGVYFVTLKNENEKLVKKLIIN